MITIVIDDRVGLEDDLRAAALAEGVSAEQYALTALLRILYHQGLASGHQCAETLGIGRVEWYARQGMAVAAMKEQAEEQIDLMLDLVGDPKPGAKPPGTES